MKFYSHIGRLEMGAVAKSYYEEGLPNIWGNAQIFSHIWGSSWLCNCSLLDFLIYEENFVFFFICVLILCALQRKSHLCIPFLGILRGLSPNFHINVSVSDLYISRIVPHIFLQQNRQIHRGNICINRSQTHQCENWDCGRAIPFLRIFVSDIRYCLFAVWVVSQAPWLWHIDKMW